MVFVLDNRKKPLMPCSEKRARQLLEKGHAVVHRIVPFTIRLKDRFQKNSELQPLRLKLDPGSKTTGMALLQENRVLFLGEIHHKTAIKQKLQDRRTLRRNRRNRKTRYRKARFLNRKRNKGWLPPSLEARVTQTINAVNKLKKKVPVTDIATEHVKLDTQLLENPDISGVQYQQGELMGYEVREYLLEKWGRKCSYCGKTDVPLEVEHIIPKSRGGSNRISNLTLACRSCNQKKGIRTAMEFGYPSIQAEAKKPLQDSAMMNATRWRLLEQLKKTGLPVECGTGARTKRNRVSLGLPKEHYFDACCVGKSTPAYLKIKTSYAQVWTAIGRGNRQMCRVNRYGFPRGHRKPKKLHFGFQTGDYVSADVPKGKHQGRHIGQVAVRATGYFDLKNGQGGRIAQGISYRYCRLIQKNVGWQFEETNTAFLPMPEGRGFRRTFSVIMHKPEIVLVRNMRT